MAATRITCPACGMGSIDTAAKIGERKCPTCGNDFDRRAEPTHSEDKPVAWIKSDDLQRMLAAGHTVAAPCFNADFQGRVPLFTGSGGTSAPQAWPPLEGCEARDIERLARKLEGEIALVAGLNVCVELTEKEARALLTVLRTRSTP